MSIRSFFVRNFIVNRPRVRRLLTRLLVGDRDVDVNLFGTPLQINSAKEHGYLPICGPTNSWPAA
jgi:hypothetical protein